MFFSKSFEADRALVRHGAIICMFREYVTLHVDTLDLHSTQGTLLCPMLSVGMFLEVNFAVEFLATLVTSHLLFHVIVLYVVVVISFRSLPSANVAHCFKKHNYYAKLL